MVCNSYFAGTQYIERTYVNIPKVDKFYYIYLLLFIFHDPLLVSSYFDK